MILTAAAVVCAGINFQQQSKFHLEDDGAIWVDRDAPNGTTHVVALHVTPDGPAAKAGLRDGDVLLKIQGTPITEAVAVPQALVKIGAWNEANYLFERDGVEAKATVYVGELEPGAAIYYQYIVGLAYLAIGIFVYSRRGGAHRGRHFYVLCLTSFILSTFHYTGKLNDFDKVIYWGNVVAGVLAPTLFLHFCLTFPSRGRWTWSRFRWPILYVPGLAIVAVYVGLSSGVLHVRAMSLVELRWMLDRVWMGFLAAMYLLGAGAVTLAYRRADDTIVRHQLKWLRNGALLGVLPFTLIYVVPYLFGAVPGPYMQLAVFSLPLVPLTWAYAVLRYRLMDVDVIFQQGYAHTLATLAVLGIAYGLILSLGQFEDLSPTAVVLLILIATFVFQPIRNWIQEHLDRYYFYRDRYDYRRTLIAFARELSSETDLDTMLRSVADRLIHTLSIQHVAFFLSDEVERPLLSKEDRRPARGAARGARPRLPVSRNRRARTCSSSAPGIPLDVVSGDWTPGFARPSHRLT